MIIVALERNGVPKISGITIRRGRAGMAYNKVATPRSGPADCGPFVSQSPDGHRHDNGDDDGGESKKEMLCGQRHHLCPVGG
jgi:hypothetical protein